MLTPQIEAKKLAEKLGIHTPLFLKREDLHPFGSHKGRSIPLMIEKYAAEGERNFVISSSGNAAIAAGLAVRDYNINHPDDQLRLIIYVGKNISPEKLKTIDALVDFQISVARADNPKQSAFLLDKTGGTKNLRQSTDDTALLGYETLATELAEIKNLSAVFVPTSSGTTAQGLYLGFKKLGINPQIHIIQTTACHPMAQVNITEESSLAGAIVDKVAHRKQAILKVLRTTGGRCWVAKNDNIRRALDMIRATENIDASANSALSVAGLTLALAQSARFDGPVACLLTGK